MYFAVSLFPEVLAIPLSLQLILAVSSLAGGIRFYRFVSKRIATETSGFSGLVTVFVPCRGREEGLRENLTSILNCGRKETEFVFIVDSKDDSAVEVIDSLVAGRADAKLKIAGPATDSGQKVHNLIEGINGANEKSVAFVFVDSDTRPQPGWLGDLLGPLNEEQVGCSSGYRWFVKSRGGLATELRAVWNASIASSLGEESNFCWGGSMAIRRDVFEGLNVTDEWVGTVSDDFVLTNLISKSDYRVHFEPKCITATPGDTSWRELLEFTTRQMKITRTYSPRHFMISIIGSAVFVISLIAGIAGIVFSDGNLFLVFFGLLAAILSLGAAKAFIRLYAVEICIPKFKNKIRTQYFWHLILWPIATFLFLLNDTLAVFSNKIVWRGIAYELVSDEKIRIIDE